MFNITNKFTPVAPVETPHYKVIPKNEWSSINRGDTIIYKKMGNDKQSSPVYVVKNKRNDDNSYTFTLSSSAAMKSFWKLNSNNVEYIQLVDNSMQLIQPPPMQAMQPPPMQYADPQITYGTQVLFNDNELLLQRVKTLEDEVHLLRLDINKLYQIMTLMKKNMEIYKMVT